MRSISYLGVALSMSMGLGCGGGITPDDGGGIDAPAGDGGCGTDGTECGANRICVSGECRDRGCGDGYVDTGEDCDDRNDVFGDGCSSCQFDCESDPECGGSDPCLGSSTCNTTTHTCVAGTPLVEGAACTTGGIPDGVCRSVGGVMTCVNTGCGNSVTEASEECDDGRNGDDTDGCRDDCMFTCETESECDDSDACTGVETCNTTSHVCVPGTALDCNDGSACTTDACAAATGCSNTLIDMDRDGHAPQMATCGDDCNDNEARMYPGAGEACDGLDNDCNGTVDDGRPTWWADCDGDGYAPTGAVMREQCDAPPASATGCGTGGSWVMRNPAISRDCCDTEAHAFPGSTYFGATTRAGCGGYDYDCDGATTMQYPSGFSGCTYAMLCGTGRGYPCSGTGAAFTPGWGNMAAALAYTTDTSPPACGASGTYVSSCIPPSGVFDCGAQTYCGFNTSTRTQGCR